MPAVLLTGCRVINLSTPFAGPLAAMMLGDHGADVVKVEHPLGDDLRQWGRKKDDHPSSSDWPTATRDCSRWTCTRLTDGRWSGGSWQTWIS
jgi:crotonobetainyl-CoA:carnitine CoA-transferase CaiB-like acyl-CoA transferase